MSKDHRTDLRSVRQRLQLPARNLRLHWRTTPSQADGPASQPPFPTHFSFSADRILCGQSAGQPVRSSVRVRSLFRFHATLRGNERHLSDQL